MKDVASLAGVSIATVSRALNGDPTVRDDRLQRVLEAVRLLGYERDDVASALRRTDRASRSIGLILEDIGNPFFSAVHRGVEDVARARQVVTLAGSSDEDAERERRLVATFSARRVDALIVVPAGPDHGYLRERAGGVPLVFLDRPPRFLDADAVLSDNVGGAHAAVSHLIAAGHRRIAFLGGREAIHTALERRRGYHEALSEHAIAEDPSLLRTDLYDAVDAHAAAHELLLSRKPPTAIFSAQNLLTLGTLRALSEHGGRRTIAHVGFDDLQLSELLDPGLTVIAQNPHALGRLAAERIFDRLDGDDRPYSHHILPTTLIARGSGEIPPTASRR
jgi:LacI family transcriptional regulator